MIIEYNQFCKCLNTKLFENSNSDLLRKIAENPERHIGLFRPTKPKTKLIQNITQSHEIRFGDALESVFELYFQRMGFQLHPKRIFTGDEELNIDQLFSIDDKLYLIEQKVRDDHDSTKKRGQFSNFEKKYQAVSEINREYKVIPIMWFIDDSLRKNQRYYQEEMDSMRIDYGCTPFLFYGNEIFAENNGIIDIPIAMWDEITSYLEKWKETLPDMPEINFDIDFERVFTEIKDIPTSIFRKLLNNNEIIEQIFPIIFRQERCLKCYTIISFQKQMKEFTQLWLSELCR